MSMKISALVKDPGRVPRHVWISNNLEALQKDVEGYIETVTLATDLVVICNEEGRLMGLEPNCNICGYDFVGTIIMVGTDGEDFTDLPADWKTMKLLFPQLWEVKQ